jgi:hypothetical protein
MFHTHLLTSLSIAVMTFAVMLGLVNDPTSIDRRSIVPVQMNLSSALSGVQGNNPLRREREESAPHYISYSESQRTPGRSGKR